MLCLIGLEANLISWMTPLIQQSPFFLGSKWLWLDMWSTQCPKWTVGWMGLIRYFNRKRNLIWEVEMYSMGNYLFTAWESFSVMQNFLRYAPQAANNNSQRHFPRISALTTEFVKTCGFYYIFQAWIQRINIVFPVKRFIWLSRFDWMFLQQGDERLCN